MDGGALLAATATPIAVDHAASLHAQRVVALREDCYHYQQPDVPQTRRWVLVDVPVPPGWRVTLGQRTVQAFGCTGELLTGQVMEGTVLVDVRLATLGEVVQRYVNGPIAKHGNSGAVAPRRVAV